MAASAAHLAHRAHHFSDALSGKCQAGLAWESGPHRTGKCSRAANSKPAVRTEAEVLKQGWSCVHARKLGFDGQAAAAGRRPNLDEGA